MILQLSVGSALKALEGDAKYTESVVELVKALDSYFPQPERPVDKHF